MTCEWVGNEHAEISVHSLFNVKKRSGSMIFWNSSQLSPLYSM